MPNYTIRVELHGHAPDHPNYTKLHTVMEQGAFFRAINGLVDGKAAKLALPPGEYVTGARIERVDQIRDRVAAIVRTVTAGFSIFVTEWGPQTWSAQGLTEIP